VPDEASFLELIRKVRAGDNESATELVKRYESAVRTVVRVRLTDPKLRQVFDSVDICQSVMADFFVRAALGQFDLEEPGQLVKLLATMARNKVTNHALAQQAARRDVRRLAPRDVGEMPVATDDPTPSVQVANRELLDQFRDRLSEEERELVDCRTAGMGWAEIAEKLKADPEVLRKRFTRALDRVSGEFGLMDPSYG